MVSLKHRLALFFFVGLMATFNAYAQSSICAEVKLEIQQKLNMERQGFIAQLQVNNGLLDQSLTHVEVQLWFAHPTRGRVTTSSDSSHPSALFFYREEEQPGITGGVQGAGVIAPRTTGSARWLLIPASGAGGNTAEGQSYQVGATLRYQLAGEVKTVDVVPEWITVQPQPVLTLDYFLPRDVYADDAETQVIEPAEPFVLGVRIQNSGAGLARQVHIESAQPRIVENRQGLQIGFQIQESRIQNERAEPTLSMSFGDIAPNRSLMGRWLMTTTLAGRFVDFTAAYTHDDALGGALTSLIRQVNTHTLIKDVLVRLPGRDEVVDFLAQDGDVLRVYESQSTENQVQDRSAEVQLVTEEDHQGIRFSQSPGMVYIRWVDASQGALRIDRVVRSDGVVLPAENVWKSKVRQEGSWIYYLHVFDANSTGQYRLYTSTPAQPASLSGYVYEDVNNNGVREPTENGLSAVLVQLIPELETGLGVAVSLSSNTEGHYQFNDISAGGYRLQVGALSGRENGSHTLGSAGGRVGVDHMHSIALNAGARAVGYGFAKRAPQAPTQADLAVQMVSSSTQLALDQSTVLTISAINEGPNTTSASVTLQLPESLALTLAHPDRGSYQAQNASWLVGSLGPRERATLSLTLRARQDAVHEVRAHIQSTDFDPIMTNNQANVVLNAEGSVRITHQIDNSARVLMLLTCRQVSGEIDHSCQQARVRALETYFARLGIQLQIAHETHTFREALRSGRFNVVWVNGGADALIDSLTLELREQVRRGNLLIVDGARDTQSATLEQQWGIRYLGVPTESSAHVLVAQDASITRLPIQGVLSSIRGTQGEIIARFDHAPALPAVIEHSLDKGRARFYAFDLAQSLIAAPTSDVLWPHHLQQWFAALVREAPVSYPAGAYVPLITQIQNFQSTALNAQMQLSLPVPMHWITAAPIPEVGSNWSVVVAPAQTQVIHVGLRLPLRGGSYTAQTAIRLPEATVVDRNMQSQQQSFQVLSVATLYTQWVSAVAQLPLSKIERADPRLSIREDLTHARKNLLQRQYESALQHAFSAVRRIEQLGIPASDAALRNAADWVYAVGAQWQALQPICQDNASPDRLVDASGFYAQTQHAGLLMRTGGAAAGLWELAMGQDYLNATQRVVLDLPRWLPDVQLPWQLEYLPNGSARLRIQNGTGEDRSIEYEVDATHRALELGESIQLTLDAPTPIAGVQMEVLLNRLDDAPIAVPLHSALAQPYSPFIRTLYAPSLRDGFVLAGTLRWQGSAEQVLSADHIQLQVRAGRMACRPELEVQ